MGVQDDNSLVCVFSSSFQFVKLFFFFRKLVTQLCIVKENCLNKDDVIGGNTSLNEDMIIVIVIAI